MKTNPYSEDQELLNLIQAIVKDSKLSQKVFQAVLKWCDRQVDWGGKYDYLLEKSQGKDT